MSFRKSCSTLFIILFSLLLDAGSKYGAILYWIERVNRLGAPLQEIAIMKLWGISCSLSPTANRGAILGIGEQWPLFILLGRIILIIALSIYLFFNKRAILFRYPLALIIGGGIGNIVDYFIYGHVLDLFHFVFWGYSYPVFNLADSLIVVGAFWLIFTPSRETAIAKKWL